MRLLIAVFVALVLARWAYTDWWLPNEQIILAWLELIGLCLVAGALLLAAAGIAGFIAWQQISQALLKYRAERAQVKAKAYVADLYAAAYERAAEVIQREEVE